MRNVYFTFLSIILCLQEIQAQNRIGVVGGGLYARSNLTNQNETGILSQSKTTFGNVYSFYGGIAYDFKVTNEFSIHSKLLFVNKGWTEVKDIRRDVLDSVSSFSIGRVPSEAVNTRETYKLGYLELPVNFTFYTPVGKSLLSFGVGPYLSYGLTGRYNFQALSSTKRIKYTQTINDTITTSTVGGQSGVIITIQTIIPTTLTTIVDSSNYLPNSSDQIRFKGSKGRDGNNTAGRFDYGASLEARLTFRNGLTFSAAYSIGVADIIKERYGAIQNRHRVIMLGLGYYYLRKKRK